MKRVFPATQLELEITESGLMGNQDQATVISVLKAFVLPLMILVRVIHLWPI
jgi:EAL domain-containing protein (putative c-di-GMP-specific phosphodiesterase class I)